MDLIYTIQKKNDQGGCRHERTATEALENGQVLHFPDTYYSMDDLAQSLLRPSILDGKHKNLSFNPKTQKVGGLHKALKNSAQEKALKAFMKGYQAFAKKLVQDHLPSYKDALIVGRTSYRPAQVSGRPSSKRKDDSRLHVDAFPATPVNGHRIMRVFCNINHEGTPRVWQLGEPLTEVIRRFYPTVPKYSALKAKGLLWVKATKALRSRYDHCMLHIHDNMKLDETYQANVDKETVELPAQSSWIVFTDQASHAALSGSQLLEQTFYLPIEALETPSTAPLSLLQTYWTKDYADKSA